MSNLFIKPEHLKMLLDIFDSYCPKAEVWAYGSRIDGSAHEGSDLDLVVKDFHTKNVNIGHLRELFSESNIPFCIDIFEFDQLPHSFQEEIKKNYIVIKSGAKKKC